MQINLHIQNIILIFVKEINQLKKNIMNAKGLNKLIIEIAELLNLATDKEMAIKNNLTHYLFLEYASAYGGYRIVNVSVINGSRSGAFGGNGCEPRLKASNMDIKLNGILDGILSK